MKILGNVGMWAPWESNGFPMGFPWGSGSHGAQGAERIPLELAYVLRGQAEHRARQAHSVLFGA